MTTVRAEQHEYSTIDMGNGFKLYVSRVMGGVHLSLILNNPFTRNQDLEVARCTVDANDMTKVVTGKVITHDKPSG